MTGMSVNLVVVDQWLAQLKADFEKTVFVSESESLSHAFAEMMAVARLNLVEQAEKEKASLISIVFKEERGWGFSWEHLQSPQELTISHSHFLEAFLHQQDSFGLIKVEFAWLRQAGCETDFQHEGFKILKNLVARNIEELCAKLALHKDGEVDSGSRLFGIYVHNLSENYVLTL